MQYIHKTITPSPKTMGLYSGSSLSASLQYAEGGVTREYIRVHIATHLILFPHILYIYPSSEVLYNFPLSAPLLWYNSTGNYALTPGCTLCDVSPQPQPLSSHNFANIRVLDQNLPLCCCFHRGLMPTMRLAEVNWHV